MIFKTAFESLSGNNWFARLTKEKCNYERNLTRTTAAAHFRKDNALKFDPQGQKSLMVSSVPMGDSEMVRIPDSEVRGNFKGQNVDHIKPSRYVKLRNTIKGFIWSAITLLINEKLITTHTIICSND